MLKTMRKILFVLAACLTFVSCESELGDFKRVTLRGKDVSGYWIFVKEISANGIESSQMEFEPEMYCFDGDIATYFRAPHVNGGWTIEGGYVYGCTFDDFDKGVSGTFEIRGNELYIAGILFGKATLQDNDTIIIERYNCIYTYKKVKGFK